MDSTAVMNFAKAILHGDDEHRNWLLEAARAFEAGEALPAVRGSGTAAMRELTNQEEKIVKQALRDSGNKVMEFEMPQFKEPELDNREAMYKMGRQADPVKDMLRRLIAEFGDEHYEQCPADNDSGPCECFVGQLMREARLVIEATP